MKTPYSTHRSGKNFFIDIDSENPEIMQRTARDMRNEVGHFFDDVGSAWLPQPFLADDGTIDEHLTSTVLLAAANASVRDRGGDPPTPEPPALDVLGRHLSTAQESADLALVLNVVACTHDTPSIGSQPLERLPASVAAHRGGPVHLAMTDVFSYTRGYHQHDLAIDGQLEPLEAVAAALTARYRGSSGAAHEPLLAALRRVASIRHGQQQSLRSYLNELHLCVSSIGGISFETNGDGVLALLPNGGSVERLREVCAQRHPVGISGVGAVRLDGATRGLRELTTRLEFVTGMAKLALADPITRTSVPTVYGEPWPPHLRDVFQLGLQHAPAKSQRWLREWIHTRPQDQEAILGTPSGQVMVGEPV